MIVDTHAHIIVPEILREVAPEQTWRPHVTWEDDQQWVEFGGKRINSAPREFVYADRILKEMDKSGVEAVLLSAWVSMVRYEVPAEETLAGCRVQNDALIALSKKYPQRIAAVGMLPMQDVPLAVKELERVMESGLKGVAIGTDVNGVYPGDARFRPFWEACEALDAFVFMHPVEGGARPELQEYYMWNVIGNPMETTIAAGHMILSGVMENLADETVVTVDADARRVYEGRVESLLSLVMPKKNLMRGSAVFNTLRSVLELVAPLNILDPDSPEFHPRKCRTLHDITRFIHEKAVEEMFSFCKDHRYSRHASKQMMDKVPMQWWVVDLDDGFKSPVKGKFVRIEDIASIPMLALWEGIIAIPWEGPPPINAGGLMSVLLQATANPGLDPALSSPYSVRNYFMISKNFCNLSSRFGFHFSTVEALVGDRAAENYVSFVFKGGAADRPRRVKRASLVAGVLEEFGFHVDVKEDGVSARFEGYPEDLVKSRLVILGYLIMHTRQLDMVMADQASVSTYRNRLTDQIKEILQPQPASVTNSRSQ